MAPRRARPEGVTERGSINIDTDTRAEARMGKRGDTGIGIGTTGIMTNELQLPLYNYSNLILVSSQNLRILNLFPPLYHKPKP
jgi:hypothetical protein